MNKKIITVILVAALLLTMFSLFSFPNVKADASQVKVLSYSWYVAPSTNVLASYPGDLVVVGEIQNMGSTNLGYVDVVASAFNSTGDFLASTENSAFVTDMLPGQKAPFYLDLSVNAGLSGDLSWVPSVTNVTVSAVSAVDTTNSLYSGLSLVSSNSNHDNGIFTVAGTIQNTGTVTIGNVWVVATFYDVSGTVVSADYTNFLTNSLVPGGVVTFTVTPADNYANASSEATNYAILIQNTPLASTSSPSPSAPVSSSPIPTPVTSTNPTKSPTSSSNYAYLIYVIVAVVAIVIVVIAVVTLLIIRKRRKKTSADMPTPPPATAVT